MLDHLLDDGAVGLGRFAHFSFPRAGAGRATRKAARPFLAAIAPLALTGCAGPLSALDPAGPAAASIATLFWVMLAGSAVLFLLVFALLWLVTSRPGFGSAVSPGRWIVWGGLVMPAAILTALVVYALFTGERLLPHARAEAPPRVVAEGRMWAWFFSYPDIPEATTIDALHIPAGVPVDVVVVSADVIHSFWVPRLAGKIDAIPGHENVLRLQADRPGTYHGVCAEFCGAGHTEMRFVVVAHAEEDYEAAVREAGTP